MKKKKVVGALGLMRRRRGLVCRRNSRAREISWKEDEKLGVVGVPCGKVVTFKKKI